MSFIDIESLVNYLLEQFVIKENAEIEKCSVISEQIRNKLETDFKDSLSPEMKIQRGEEEEEIIEPKPIEFSTPLKIEEINEIYDRQKEDYLRTALKLNETDLEVAAEVADAENEALYEEIINLTPGLVVDDDDINVDTQFDFQNSDLDTSFRLSDTLQNRIDDIVKNAWEKVSSLKFPGVPTKNIPNDPLYPLSQIETEDIYIDDSLRDMLYPGDPIYFPQPSTGDRKDFEVNVTGDEMIVFKSPALTLATFEKKELKNIFKKIIEDLKLNITQTLMSQSDKNETKQKFTLLRNFYKRLGKIKKVDLEKQLELHKWLNTLITDQLIANKSYYKFGENYEVDTKFKNVTIRKRKLLPLTLEDRLENLPSIYAKVPADLTKKIESAKEIFSNIIKQIPRQSYKNLKLITINQTILILVK